VIRWFACHSGSFHLDWPRNKSHTKIASRPLFRLAFPHNGRPAPTEEGSKGQRCRGFPEEWPDDNSNSIPSVLAATRLDNHSTLYLLSWIYRNANAQDGQEIRRNRREYPNSYFSRRLQAQEEHLMPQHDQTNHHAEDQVCRSSVCSWGVADCSSWSVVYMRRWSSGCITMVFVPGQALWIEDRVEILNRCLNCPFVVMFQQKPQRCHPLQAAPNPQPAET
jgi:hypothetical protein